MLGLPLDLITLDQSLELLSTWVSIKDSRKTVVTSNPEFIVQCQTDTVFAADILKADLITADGIGMVLAGKKFGLKVPRATGVDIARGIMQKQGSSLRVFFLGAKPNVAQRAAERTAMAMARLRHAHLSLHLRHRAENTDFKSGNIRDWVAAEGGRL